MYEFKCIKCGTCSPHNQPCFVCGCGEKQRVRVSSQTASAKEAKQQDFEQRKRAALERRSRGRKG